MWVGKECDSKVEQERSRSRGDVFMVWLCRHVCPMAIISGLVNLFSPSNRRSMYQLGVLLFKYSGSMLNTIVDLT